MEILLADDHVYTRKGLEEIIKSEFKDAVITEAENGLVVLKLARERKFDIIILDINMPRLNGIETMKQLQQYENQAPILILSMYSEDQYAIRAIKAGASGYLTKMSAAEELIKALHSLLGGRKYITQSLAEKLAGSLGGKQTQSPHEQLSDREFMVLKMIASGKQVSAIAAELNLSIPTVSTYRARILFKMQMKTNAELTHYAISSGLMD
ncbi:MAG: response regulator transcription factor [Bacteroidota bacterium]